jgi:DNA repair protein RadD
VPTLESVLPRLGAVTLSQLLGPTVVELIGLLDERQAAPHRLADLLIRELGEEALLLTRKTRVEILSALTAPDARDLAQLLSVDESDPWSSICALSFRRGQQRTETLFNFFGLAAPEDEEPAPPAALKVEASYPLFPHQLHAARRVLRILSGDKRVRVLLHMPTGSGKTRTAMNVLAHTLRYRCDPGELAIWLAYSEELCDQAADEFVRAWAPLGDRAVMLHRHYGSFRTDLGEAGGGILVAGLSLLYQDSLKKQSAFLELARRTRLVIFDEAHQASAPTYRHLLHLLAPDERTAVLGLSATPGRAWLDAAQDLELANYFYRQKVTLKVQGYADPVTYLQDKGYLAKTEYVPLTIPGPDVELTPKEFETLALGLDLPESALKRIGSDARRNLLITSRVLTEWKPGIKVLVFACSVEHARLLAAVLRLKGCPAACVTGDTPAPVRHRAIEQYRSSSEVDVLTNYGVLTTGFDAPRTSVAVIARPTRSVVLYSQMVGRAARGPLANGNETCRIITVVDSIPGFRSIAEGFAHWDDVWPDEEEESK